ncbi:MFS transporter [Paenibacillus tarimensis]|uniref:MFS transporter n=1 Tax=Paenibacillus tarimensis TaxID=416012 RepID=UPI001F18FFA5|nr:MFS transporter [Paenibacillus tarimensis]MCF2945041.1 MFS transporter [Paenibacillus tarimensis]
MKWPKRASLPPERQLSKEAGLTITIHALFQFGASMAGLFLNLYLWRLTEDLVVNGVYNIIVYFLTPIGFAVGGWIGKRKDRMVTYRLGILSMGLFFLLVVLAQEQVVSFYLLFAVLNGFASGLYWMGFLVLMYDVSHDRNRIRFLALNMVFFNAAGLAGPALAGYIIGSNEGLRGYMITFMLAFVMFLIAAVVSLRIGTITTRHKVYYLNLMGLLMRKNRVWLQSLIGFFVFGLFQGIMLFLPNILLYRTVGREDLVGYLGVFFSGLVIASGYVISRKAKESGARRYILASSTGVVLGASFLVIDVSFWTVVLFMILFSISNPLAINTLNTYYYRLMGTLPLKGQLRNEVVVVREFYLNFGRMISIALLLLFSQDLESAWLPVVLVGTALLQYTIFWMIGTGQGDVQKAGPGKSG